MDLVLNYLAKFVARGKSYVTRQQFWIANVVRTMENQTGFTCFCLDKRPCVSGAARYRSMVENPETQYCYLNSNNSDKLFNTFVSKRTDDKDSINFVIAKHVGEIASGQVYELKTNQNEPSSTDEKEHQLRNQQDRGVSSTRNSRLQFKSTRTTPGFLLAHRNRARKEMPPQKKRKVERSKFESKLVSSRSTAKRFLQNRQMGKACKRDWDSDIPYIRNIFAFLTVWLNPIRIDAKLGSFCNPVAAQWYTICGTS